MCRRITTFAWWSVRISRRNRNQPSREQYLFVQLLLHFDPSSSPFKSNHNKMKSFIVFVQQGAYGPLLESKRYIEDAIVLHEMYDEYNVVLAGVVFDRHNSGKAELLKQLLNECQVW